GTPDQLRVSAGEKRALPAGLGYAGGDHYMGSYTALVDDRQAVYLAELVGTVGRVGDPQRVTQVGPDSFAWPIVGPGDRFGTAWSDRRDAVGDVINFEVYFNALGPDGKKLGADLRITHSEGFSVGPSLAWNNSEFVLVWQDDGISFDGLHHI